MSPEDDALTARVSAPSVDASLGMKLLPAVLSLTAGSVDVISFLGLGGLFTAHITGNLVILASRIVTGREAPIAPMLSVPVFTVVLGLTRLLVGGLESIGFASLRPLLLLQFMLLAGFFILCAAAGPRTDPNTGTVIVAGMFGVSAMAVQNALVQVSLKEAPSTAVMTTNVTRFTMDFGKVLRGEGAAPSEPYLAGDPRIRRRLRPRCGVRSHIRTVVPGAARGPGLARTCG